MFAWFGMQKVKSHLTNSQVTYSWDGRAVWSQVSQVPFKFDFVVFCIFFFFFVIWSWTFCQSMVTRHYSIWSVLILHDELYNCTRDLQKRFPRKEIWNIGRYPQCSRLTFSKLQILLIQIVFLREALWNVPKSMPRVFFLQPVNQNLCSVCSAVIVSKALSHKVEFLIPRLNERSLTEAFTLFL